MSGVWTQRCILRERPIITHVSVKSLAIPEFIFKSGWSASSCHFSESCFAGTCMCQCVLWDLIPPTFTHSTSYLLLIDFPLSSHVHFSSFFSITHVYSLLTCSTVSLSLHLARFLLFSLSLSLENVPLTNHT